MTEQYDPYSQPFQLGGLEALTQPDPMRLARELLARGMPVEDVALQTGVSVDDLMMGQIDNRLQTRRNIDDMTGVYSMPPQPDVDDSSYNVQNIDMSSGIASTLDPNMMQMPNNMMDEAFTNQMTEGLVDTMDFLGLTKDEDTADDVDGVVAAQINASAEKVQSAQASGDPTQIALATEDAQNLTLLNASILDYLGKTPEARQEAMNIYREAAETMLGGEDLDKFIRRPDKALPYMAAGMALTQSGEKGEDWITALSNAFSKYAITKKQGEMEFQDKYLQFKLNQRARIDDFATNLALKDVDAKIDTLTEGGSPFIVDGQLEFMTDREALVKSRQGSNVRPYESSLDGEVKDYTVTAPDGNAFTTLLTNSAASYYQKAGYGVTEGNLLKDKEQYQVIYPNDFDSSKYAGTFFENRPSFVNYSDAEINTARTNFPELQFTDSNVDMVPILRYETDSTTNEGRLVPRLVPESQINYFTDQRQYASESIVFGKDGSVEIIKGFQGNRTIEKSKSQAFETFSQKVNDAGEVYVILDDIMRVVTEGGAQLPGGTRSIVNFLQRGVDELKGITDLVPIFSENRHVSASGDSLSFSKNTVDNVDVNGTVYSINTNTLFDNFLGNTDTETLLGKNRGNREYEALTFNLAIALAKTMGLGEGRALSDKDLVYALKQAGLASTNIESLQDRHAQIKKQTISGLFRAKNAMFANPKFISDEDWVASINNLLDTDIDPLRQGVTYNTLFEGMQKGGSEVGTNTGTNTGGNTKSQNTYSTRYTPFFSSLSKEDNFPAMLQRISKKANEVSNESSSVREMFMRDLKNYTLTLPQDQKFLIADKIQEIMKGVE